MFPEGTRRSGPVIEELHEGAAFLAARTGAPIIPIGVGGTSDADAQRSKVPRPVKVRLIVGDPIPAPERQAGGRVARSKVHAVTEQLRSELQDLYDLAESSSRESDDGPERPCQRRRSRHQVRRITRAYWSPK